MEEIMRKAKELGALCEKEDVTLLCVFGNAGSKMGYEAYFSEKAHELITKANTTLMNNATSKRRTMEINV
jgi:hypothetical protein